MLFRASYYGLLSACTHCSVLTPHHNRFYTLWYQNLNSVVNSWIIVAPFVCFDLTKRERLRFDIPKTRLVERLIGNFSIVVGALSHLSGGTGIFSRS